MNNSTCWPSSISHLSKDAKIASWTAFADLKSTRAEGDHREVLGHVLQYAKSRIALPYRRALTSLGGALARTFTCSMSNAEQRGNLTLVWPGSNRA